MLPDHFTPLPELVRGHGRSRAAHPAIIDGETVLGWAELDALIDRAAAALARDGAAKGDVVAICAGMSAAYLIVWLGALRAGLAAAPISPGMTAEVRAGMIADSGAVRTFDDAALGGLADWLAPPGAPPPAVAIEPGDPFNLIYSSGTTGTPKGIVQPHAMRWAHVQRGLTQGYGPDAVTLVSTPLYSNTTLVSVFPTIGLGGTLVLLPKFDPAAFLDLSVRHRVSHAMLVPVQYRRLMEYPDFDRHDLSSYRGKFCTSAPFSAELKAEILARWPGGLTEYYGMTEGGGTCILRCHERPDKLATVGSPAAGSEIRVIDDAGTALPPGEAGEVVGRSPAMMVGYHNRPEATAAAEWYDAEGVRFIRTGDVGRFDADGFLTLVDRKKDVIISGGFNLYPSDLEQVLTAHPAVAEAAVVAAPSPRWGETPFAFVTLRAPIEPEALRSWANARLSAIQRIAGIAVLDRLPRSEIGKVLKKDLVAAAAQALAAAAGG